MGGPGSLGQPAASCPGGHPGPPAGTSRPDGLNLPTPAFQTLRSWAPSLGGRLAGTVLGTRDTGHRQQVRIQEPAWASLGRYCGGGPLGWGGLQTRNWQIELQATGLQADGLSWNKTGGACPDEQSWQCLEPWRQRENQSGRRGGRRRRRHPPTRPSAGLLRAPVLLLRSVTPRLERPHACGPCRLTPAAGLSRLEPAVEDTPDPTGGAQAACLAQLAPSVTPLSQPPELTARRAACPQQHRG